MSDFIRAEEYCVAVKDGTHNSPKKTENGVKLATSKNIIGGNLDLSTAYFISEEDANEVNKRSKVDKNDILISMIGTVGEVCLIKDDPDFVIKNVGLLKNKCAYKAKWLYFYLKTNQAQNLIKERLRGTTQQYLSLGELRNFPVLLPKNEDHLKNAVNILWELEQKIQLNTQINQTLEQIAQTIFKSWFIDFDPVHAKANALASGQTTEQATQAAMAVISGKNTQELHRLQTANPEQYQQLWEIAEAFPSGVDEEGVPVGWTVKRIENVIKKIPTGKKYSQKTAVEVGNVPILDQGKSGLIGYHNDEAGVKASIENPVIVFANHTCYMRLISYDFSAIQNIFVFVGKESNVLWTYLATLGKQEFTEYKGHFPDFLIKEIVVPNNELTELFGVFVKEHFQQIACNDKQNQTLANLRNELLPKLLSGEV